MALIQCTNCTKEYQDNQEQCPHCGNSNIITQHVEELRTTHVKPSPFLVNPESITPIREVKKLDKRIRSASMVFLLVLTVVLYTNYQRVNQYQLTQLDAQLKHNQVVNEKMNEILMSLFSQTRYWTISLVETDAMVAQHTNEVCVVVGLSFKKNVDSPFYLDDSYDDGLFHFTTLLLNLNNSSFSHRSIPECSSLNSKYSVVYPTENFHIRENEVYYFLTKITSNQFKARNSLNYAKQTFIELKFDDQ